MTPTARAAAPLAAALFLLAPLAAQAAPKATVSREDVATAAVTITSIDRATRHVVVTNEAGEHFTLKAPPEVRNLDRMNPGDKIHVRYKMATEYVLSKANSPLPADAVGSVTARAPVGDAPGAAAASLITVTGAIVGVDKAHHTIKLVSPQGGEVFDVAVQTPDGVKAMDKMKIGDTITAHITESIMLSVEP
jgi:hypothetical protein